MLGHASTAMTLDIYAHLFDDDLDDVSARLDDAATKSVVGVLWGTGELETQNLQNLPDSGGSGQRTDPSFGFAAETRAFRPSSSLNVHREVRIHPLLTPTSAVCRGLWSFF
jgi:hypothetical protein